MNVNRSSFVRYFSVLAICSVLLVSSLALSAPMPVTNLTASPSGANVILSWTVPSPTSGMSLIGMQIRFVTGTASIDTRTWPRCAPLPGVPAPGTPGSLQSMMASGLAPGTTYKFAIEFRDGSGWAPLSNVAITVTRDATKTTTLAWDASIGTYSDMTYRVYYGTSTPVYGTSSFVDAGSALSVSVPGLTWGVTYYYAAMALSQENLAGGGTGRSDFSNVVSESR